MRLLLCIIACYIILVAGIPKVASSFWTYKTWKVFQPKPTQPTHHLCCSVWSLLIFYLNHSKRILQLSYFIVSSNHVWRHNLPASSTCVCMCVCVIIFLIVVMSYPPHLHIFVCLLYLLFNNMFTVSFRTWT